MHAQDPKPPGRHRRFRYDRGHSDHLVDWRRWQLADGQFSFQNSPIGLKLDTDKSLLDLLDQTLNLNGRSAGFDASTHLLGAVPELDSMGVVSLIAAIEERFGIEIDDDEIDGSVFETFGSLLAFVTRKLDD
jgi:acyl carrier protein